MEIASPVSMGLKPEVVERMRTIFCKCPAVDEVVVYGSRAKGNYRPGSDIDLTLRGDALTYENLQTIEQQLDDLLLPYKIDLSLAEEIDNPHLLDHIARVGKIFFKRAS